MDFDGDLPRGNAPDVDRDLGQALPEASHQRQKGMDGSFVRADEHAAALEVAELAHRRLGFFREPNQPLPIILEHTPGIGERPALRRPVEQLLAELALQTPDRLTDGRLRPVHPRRGAREAALLRHRQEDVQRRQVHKIFLL